MTNWNFHMNICWNQNYSHKNMIFELKIKICETRIYQNGSPVQRSKYESNMLSNPLKINPDFWSAIQNIIFNSIKKDKDYRTKMNVLNPHFISRIKISDKYVVVVFIIQWHTAMAKTALLVDVTVANNNSILNKYKLPFMIHHCSPYAGVCRSCLVAIVEGWYERFGGSPENFHSA